MDENNHLPLYGIGPYLIGLIAFITIIAMVASYFNHIPKYGLNPQMMTIAGLFLIILGVVFWISAVKNSDIQENIRQNSLVTTGIYGIVRHPIYAAFLYAIIGIILIANNMTLFILPIIYWIILTVTMRKTEEKWLLEKYGDDYLDYMKKVNGFIPKVI